MKKKFSVNGMMCASCQANVNNCVSKLDGVTSVNVSLLSKSMIVEFDESKISTDDICGATNAIGYPSEIFVNESLKAIQAKKAKELKKRLSILIATIVLTVILMTVSMGGMILHDNAIYPTSEMMGTKDGALVMIIEVALQILLVIPIAILNFQFFTKGFKALFKLHPNMDSLVALGSTVAFIYGVYVFVTMIVSFASGNYMESMEQSMNVYIEGAGSILCFVSLGKFIENRATNKTASSIASLVSLVPDTATKINEDGSTVEVSTEDLEVGDRIQVKPGEAIATDGIIISGYVNVDESLITGESLPVFKKEGAKVIGGSINKEGAAVIEVCSVGKDTTVSKIITLVQEAADSKAPLARLADRIALYFVPSVICIAVLTCAIWLLSLGLSDGNLSSSDLSLSLKLGISVLVISCPCALGLATPVAIMAGTGKGAENGILIKSAEAFESMNKVDTVVFDKTGTLTKGEMGVSSIKVYEGNENEILSVAASVEQYSEHPVSKAIVRKSLESGNELNQIDGFVNVPGMGVVCGDIVIGNSKLMEKENVDISLVEPDFQSLSSKGQTVIFFANQKRVQALFAIADIAKEEAGDAIASLKEMGKHVILLTGDNKATADAIAATLGIDEVYSDVVPGEKKAVIESVQSKGHKVAYVGDGVNDAPSLIQADVGVAIGAGSDVAIDSADIVLVHSDPTDVVTAIRLSKKVTANIKENLLWAFFYNVILIPIAAGALYSLPGWFGEAHFALNPTFASIAMSLSSITVVCNALRLRLFKKKIK